jgi:hypothetical protein
MRFSFLTLLLAVPATAAVAPPGRVNSTLPCPTDHPVFAGEKDGAKAKKLGELPPAQLYLSVDRKVDGCRKPVILRYGIGGRRP